MTSLRAAASATRGSRVLGARCASTTLLHTHSEVTKTPSKRSAGHMQTSLSDKLTRLDLRISCIRSEIEMSSSFPSQPHLPHQLSLPRQLSEECVAQFMLDLPLLHEDRLSPALLECAAKLRSQFTDASSKAQTGIRDMREAWIAWHALPVISSGIVFCCIVSQVECLH